MHCPEPDCQAHAIIDRAQAVSAVCAKLADVVCGDQSIVHAVVAAVERLAAAGSETRAQRVVDLQRAIQSRTNRINDLTELAGEGSDADRAALKVKVRAALTERAELQLELTRTQQQAVRPPKIKPDDVRRLLSDFGTLLQDGASGKLGSDAVFRAADLFRRLVGGRVEVVVEIRPGRKRGIVRGKFVPAALASLKEKGDGHCGAVEVWLRPPPRLDALADEIRRLYEEEGFGFRRIAQTLGIGCGNVYQSYMRYYEMRNLPVPPRRPRGRYPSGGPDRT
jgi:hypothetical protein